MTLTVQGSSAGGAGTGRQIRLVPDRWTRIADSEVEVQLSGDAPASGAPDVDLVVRTPRPAAEGYREIEGSFRLNQIHELFGVRLFLAAAPSGVEVSLLRQDPGILRSQLPMVMAEQHFPARFLMGFEDIIATLEDHLETQPHVLDPSVAPIEMVRFVARWAGFEVSPAMPVDRQRNLVHAAGEMVRWRGTNRGLATMLEAFTGGEAQVQDYGGVYRQGDAPTRRARIKVRLSEAGELEDSQLLRLIQDHLPTDAVVELTVGDRKVEDETESEESE